MPALRPILSALLIFAIAVRAIAQDDVVSIEEYLQRAASEIQRTRPHALDDADKRSPALEGALTTLFRADRRTDLYVNVEISVAEGRYVITRIGSEVMPKHPEAYTLTELDIVRVQPGKRLLVGAEFDPRAIETAWELKTGEFGSRQTHVQENILGRSPRLFYLDIPAFRAGRRWIVDVTETARLALDEWSEGSLGPRREPGAAELAAWRLARRFAAERGASGPDHSRFRENIAAYLRNGVPESFLRHLGARTSSITIDEIPFFKRHRDAVVRDLRSPYTNAEVDARIAQSAEALAAAFREIRRLNVNGSPYRLILVKGFTSGRVAAFSDVDLMFDTLDEELRRRVSLSRFDYKHRGSHLLNPVGVGPYDPGFRHGVDLGDGTEFLRGPTAALRAIYEKGRERTTGMIDGEKGRLPIREEAEIVVRLRELHYRQKIDLREITGQNSVAALKRLGTHRDPEVRRVANEMIAYVLAMRPRELAGATETHTRAVYEAAREEAETRVEKVVASYPALRQLFELGRKHGITLGVGGGMARDALLGRPIGPFSDLDLVFDSREAGWTPFHEELKRKVEARELPGLPEKFDYYADFNPESPRFIEEVLTTRGFTLEKIAVMSDGSVVDSTGRGIADLLEGRLHYHVFKTRSGSLALPTLLRMARMKGQYPGFEYTPETERLLREGVRAALAGDPRVAEMRAFGRMLRAERPAITGALLEQAGSGYLTAERDLGKLFKNAVSREKAVELLVEYDLDRVLKVAGLGQSLSTWVLDAELRAARLRRYLETEHDARLREKVLDIKRWSDRELLDRLVAGLRKAGRSGLDAIAGRVSGQLDGTRDPVEVLRREAAREWAIPETEVAGLLEAIETTTVQGRRDHRRHFIQPVPSVAGAVSSVREIGWPAETLQFDLTQPNTAVDPARYARERLPEPMIRDIVERGVPVEVHGGTYAQTVGDLASRGYEKVFRLDPARGYMQKEILLAFDPHQKRSVYAIRNPYGVDAERHLFLMLRVATGGRISSLTRVSHEGFDREGRVRLYLELFAKSGLAPDGVLMGAGGGMFRSFRERSAYGAAYEELVARHGTAIVSELARAAGLDGAGLDGRTTADFFRDSVLSERLVAVGQAVVAARFADARFSEAQELFRRAAVLAKEQKGIVYHERDRALTYEIYQYRDTAGKPRTLFVTDFLYGDGMAEAAEALVRMGAKRVLVQSGAGSLVATDPVGLVRIPAEFQDARGRIAIVNALLPHASRDPMVAAGGRHGKSYSPLADTVPSVEGLRAQGIDTVEVEVSEVARALSRHAGVKFGAGITVLNVLGTRHTLDEHRVSNGNASRLTADMALGFFEMASMEGPLASQILRQALKAAPPAAPEERAQRLADLLAAEKGATGPEYSRFRENIAAYLRNGLPDAFLTRMKELPATPRIGDLPLFSRHASKLARDLERPYTNVEVEAQIDRLSEQLREAVEIVQRLNTGESRYRLLIGGSIAKGRVGANSDIDVMIDSPDSELEERVTRSRYGVANPSNPKDGTIRIAPYGYAKVLELAAIQPLVDIGEGGAILNDARGEIRRIYEAGRARFMKAGDTVRQPLKEAPEALDRLYDLDRQGRLVLKRDQGVPTLDQLRVLTGHRDSAVRQAARELAIWFRGQPASFRSLIDNGLTAQPNRQVRRELKAGAVRESAGAGKFAAAFLVKEGVASLETGDPGRMKQAAQSLATWEFWGTLGAFTAGAHGANRALELGKVNPRLKGHAGKFVRTGLPLAVGMAASQAMMGELDAKRLAVGTGSFMGAGYLVDGVADRVIKATLGSLPQGRVGRGVYAIGKLAAMLYAGEKMERAVDDYVLAR